MYKNIAVVFLGDNYYYNLGFFKAIKENNIYEKFKASTGTALGTLFSILFANNDYKSMEELCSLLDNINKDKPNKENVYDRLNMYTINKKFGRDFLTWGKYISNKGIIKREDLSNILKNKNVNILGENEYHMNCYHTYYQLPFMGKKIVEFSNCDKITEELILNSVAEPVILNQDNIKTRTYITSDINYKDTIDTLRGKGYKKILVVNSEKDRYNIDFNDNDILEIKNNIFQDNKNINKNLKYYMIEQGYKDTMNFIKCSLKSIA